MNENEKSVSDINRGKQSMEEYESDGVKSGFFHKAIPIMPKFLAIICCILNIIIPGLGTLISSFSIFCCAKHKCESNSKAFLTNILAFVLQLCSAVILIGWVWSIKYGLLFIHLSNKTDDDSPLDAELPIYVRRHSSMDASLMYNAKPRLSSIALTKVKEEET